MNNIAVNVENLAVHYEKIIDHPTSLKEFAVRALSRKINSSYVEALKGISFTVERGEVFGIVGRNGAGKSTLLKALSRIILPTYGRVVVYGQLTPLLGIGAGFHPELSGVENLYLYSALLGRTQQQTKALYDQIVSFAGLQAYMDSPIRTYSTGMVARLGFSVAMATAPNILLIDEVLSVGDEEFRSKCFARFEELRSQGTAILLISHNLPYVLDLCNRTAWLHKGSMMSLGPSAEVIGDYRKFITQSRDL